jgi:dihydropteroate synthase
MCHGFDNKVEKMAEQGIRLADSLLLRTARREITLGERTLIMGILNVTPDSFSDGGRFKSVSEAVEEGLKMVEGGADIIDIGGESTRPGSDAVSTDEELRRVIPVVRGLAGRTDIPLCVDTMKSGVAREAVAEGAEIINDVSAMAFDPSMAEVAVRSSAAVVLMHMRGVPKSMQTGDLTYPALLPEIIGYLKGRMEHAAACGIEATRIMIDPGIGFGKTAADNMRLIKYLSEFKSLGRPILVGASRKAFVGRITGGTPAERSEGTAAAVTAAILHGGHVMRVHDVRMMKKVATMADAIMRA